MIHWSKGEVRNLYVDSTVRATVFSKFNAVLIRIILQHTQENHNRRSFVSELGVANCCIYKQLSQ